MWLDASTKASAHVTVACHLHVGLADVLRAGVLVGLVAALRGCILLVVIGGFVATTFAAIRVRFPRRKSSATRWSKPNSESKSKTGIGFKIEIEIESCDLIDLWRCRWAIQAVPLVAVW